MSGCFDLQDVNNIFSLPFVIHLSVLKTLGLTFCWKEVDESKEPLCAATNMLGIAFLINISPTEVNGTLSDISRYIYIMIYHSGEKTTVRPCKTMQLREAPAAPLAK